MLNVPLHISVNMYSVCANRQRLNSAAQTRKLSTPYWKASALAVQSGNFDITSAKDSDFDSFAETESIKYIEKIFSGNHTDARQKAFFRRMKNTASLLIRNIADEMNNSRFVPYFFELPVSYTEGAVPPHKNLLEDETAAEIFGRIDRVDLMQNGENIYVRITDYKTGLNVRCSGSSTYSA